MMELLAIQLVASLIFVAMILVKSKPSLASWRVCLASLFWGAVGVFCIAPLVVIQSVLTFFLVGLLTAGKAERSVCVKVTWTCAVVAFGITLTLIGVEVRDGLAIRAEFPFVPISHRLNYEQKSSGVIDEAVLELAADTLKRLTRLEANIPGNDRIYRLRQLHSDQYVEFIMNIGFGSDRMPGPRRSSLVLPDDDPVQFPERPADVDPTTAAQPPDLLAGQSPMVPKLSLPALHESGLMDFGHPVRFGLILSRDKVSGFEPHMLTKLWSQSFPVTLAEWQLSHLDLVSLLKFAEPRVYLSEHLPRMDELRNAETRPVDDFEQRALQQLRDGEDIVIDQQIKQVPYGAHQIIGSNWEL